MITGMYGCRSTPRIPLARLLILALVLRTFIAPGYMLAFSPAGGLGIIFCDGPVSLTVDPADKHSHHGHHDDEDAGFSISPTCSYWSTSGLGFVTPDVIPVPSVPTVITLRAEYDSQPALQTGFIFRSIRAPPFPA